LEKDFNELCGDPGHQMNTEPFGILNSFLHIQKTRAILNKIAYKIQSKCYKKCGGNLQIEIKD